MLNLIDSAERQEIERKMPKESEEWFINILEGRQAEMEFQESSNKLERKVTELTTNLERANNALRLMLKKEEELKSEYEDKIRCNIRQLVLPLIQKLKTTQLDSRQKKCVTLLELNLDEIMSPFLLKMSKDFVDLTPTEIKIANFLKDGMCTKEIADSLCVSVRTIESHRSNIRKKLGLKYKNISTVSYLKSLAF